LTQASRNAQDGISLIQTAEGALNETHAILQRMRELAVQSSTDTNTDADRSNIQDEINQLATEITRIAETTEFNTMGLLDGTYADKKFHIGANEGQEVAIQINNMSAQELKVSGDGEGKANYEIEGEDITLADTANFDNLAINAGENKTDVVKVDNITIGGYVANYGLANEKGEIVAISTDGKTYNLLTEATSKKDLASATVSEASIEFTDAVTSGKVTFKGTEATNSTITEIKATASIDVKGLETGTYTAKTITETNFNDYFATSGDGKILISGANALDHEDITSVLLDKDGKVAAVQFATPPGVANSYYAVDDINFTASHATAGDRITAAIGDAEVAMTKGEAVVDGEKFTVKADGGIDVSTQPAASKAITTINNALETVSKERSKLGAMQNRLEHTIKNLDTSAENLQASEARIRDVDMAKEMMEFTKNNILTQAAQAMLAQANAQPQGVLQLLS
jgi:flagellin